MAQLVVPARMGLALLHKLQLAGALGLRHLPFPVQIAGQVVAQPALRGFREEVPPGIGRRLQRLQRPLGHPPEPVAGLAGQLLRHPPDLKGALPDLVPDLHRRDLETGVVTMCIGGGQGIATVLEAVE